MESLLKFSPKKIFLNLNLSSSLRYNEKLLPKLRLVVFSLALVHLVTVTVFLLTIDFTRSEIPEVRAYDHLRWKLITTWFNLLMGVYFPLCIYCDWWEVNGNIEGTTWRTLKNIRNVMFTSILLPSTVLADLLFWRLYNKNEYYLMPKGIEYTVPFWTQHSMHTISLVVVILDLVLTPRRRPKSLIPGLAITLTFISSYQSVVAHSWSIGEQLYPFLMLFSPVKLIILTIYFLVEASGYYFGQWLIIDFIWHRKSSKSQKNM